MGKHKDVKVGRIEQLTEKPAVLGGKLSVPLAPSPLPGGWQSWRLTQVRLTQEQLAAVIPAAFDAVWEKRLKDDERMASALAEELLKRLPPLWAQVNEEV